MCIIMYKFGCSCALVPGCFVTLYPGKSFAVEWFDSDAVFADDDVKYFSGNAVTFSVFLSSLPLLRAALGGDDDVTALF